MPDDGQDTLSFYWLGSNGCVLMISSFSYKVLAVCASLENGVRIYISSDHMLLYLLLKANYFTISDYFLLC
jgi:hypothetical protein